MRQTESLYMQKSPQGRELKEVIQKHSVKRLELIVQLGELAYQKIRNEGITDQELTALAEALPLHDRAIFHANQILEKQRKSNQPNHCECGAIVTEADKFCGSCGRPVLVPTSEDEAEKVICHTCEEQIPSSSSFCSCCGAKVHS